MHCNDISDSIKIIQNQSFDFNKNIIRIMSNFHKFIETADSKPKQCRYFPEFQFMENQIKKNFIKQKKGSQSSLVSKPCDEFADYFKQLERDDQISLYLQWIQILQMAIDKKTNTRECLDMEGEFYLKKQKTLISSWEKYTLRLSNLTIYAMYKKLKVYPLKFYHIRKSKNKEHFSWVMEVINQDKEKYKSFHCGTNNIQQFNQWFKEIQERVWMAKLDDFRQKLEQFDSTNQKKVLVNTLEKNLESNLQKVTKSLRKQSSHESKNKQKTMTELLINNKVKYIDEKIQKIQQSKTESIEQKTYKPNVLKKLLPNCNFQYFLKLTDNINEGTLIYCDKQYRLSELEKKQQDDSFRIKISFIINSNKSAIFQTLTSDQKVWNTDIDVYNFKTKISSQNSALIYQKDKSLGFLYRQRDYVFLKHCFSIKSQNQKEKIFIIEKSIDTISQPPFMSVARGEKQLIYCIAGNKEDKQCLLVIEGWIKGGGYMKNEQDKQITIKYFKKLLQIQGYIKQMSYSKISESQMFQEYWPINIEEKDSSSSEDEYEEKRQNTEEEGEEQFYSPKGFDDEDENNKDKIQEKNKQRHEQEKEFQQFIKQTSVEKIEHHEQMMEKAKKIQSNSQESIYEDIPMVFNKETRMIEIPQKYISVSHELNPREKPKKPSYFPHYRGHHLMKGQWELNPSGGLKYIDEEKLNQQKKVLTYIIKRIGKNILTGKGILNVSLPVDIFCRDSNIQRLAISFGFCPNFLEKGAKVNNPVDQIKSVISLGLSSQLAYLTMEKPFNPILGQTYQCWIDECPAYFQQISHHPPTAAFYMVGRGYTMSGSIEAKMDISINSGKGTNEGIFTVKFDNGHTYHFTTAAGEVSGLTYGERKLLLDGKTYYWSIEDGLFIEIQYNPGAKKLGFFGRGAQNLIGDQKYWDYFQGTMRRYRKEDLEQFFTPKKNDTRKVMLIPKSSPACEPLQDLYKVSGRWPMEIYAGEERIFNNDVDRYYKIKQEAFPLASHSAYREDIAYRRMNNFVLSQEFKEILEIKQRKDQKLREEFKKRHKYS